VFQIVPSRKEQRQKMANKLAVHEKKEIGKLKYLNNKYLQGNKTNLAYSKFIFN
jgi:hypothetical protein